MNRNYIKKIILGLMVLVVSVSCESEWFDKQSNMQLSAEEQFQSQDGFKDALIGAYLGMTAPELYAKDMTWNMVDLLSQQYAALPVFGEYSDIQQFNYESVHSSEQIRNTWAKAYNVIANIDLALEMTEKNRDVLGDIDYSIIKGELLGLRAFIHFDLIRLFGYGNLEERPGLMHEYTIPYVQVFSKEITPQLTYAETFDLMEQDIEEALNLLKEDPAYGQEHPSDYYQEANRDGFYDHREQRMNYFAVKALQARIFQWKGDQQNAAAAAEEVISNSFARLIDSDSHPVASDRIFYQELLFSLDVDGLSDIIDDLLTASSGTSANADAIYHTAPYVDEIFETDSVEIGLADVRYNTFMEQQARGVVNTKLLQQGLTAQTYNQIPLIRLSEMYYIAAEAYMKSGDLGRAIDYLNKVRASRGIIQDIPENASAEEVKFEIEKEYQKEFLGEGQLFFYYKRTGATEIPGIGNSNITPDDNIYVLPYPDSELEFGTQQ